ncbi:MAG: hypothetical protein MK085_10415 [Phycisphaerales bacterium]|nr:hypothetical protein [Phycisphaerales bacterium]
MKAPGRISLAIAVFVGVLAATLIATLPRNMTGEERLRSRVNVAKMLVISPDPEQRASGWDRVTGDWSDADLADLEDRLVTSDSEIILDAALQMSTRGIGPVSHGPVFANALADDAHDPHQALAWFHQANTHPLGAWRGTLARLLGSSDPEIRQAALEALFTTTSATERRGLDEFASALPPDDRRHQAVLALALGLHGHPGSEPVDDESLSATAALRSVLASRANGTPASSAALAATPASLLHLADEASGTQALRTQRDAGNEAASRVLRMRDRDQALANARAVIERKSTDIELRRLAGWKLPELDDGTTHGLLQAAPADGAGSVHATAMLAEKHLSPQAASALVRRWLVDPETDRRRAAAILAILTGEEIDELLAAEAREDAPSARRTMRLALRAAGRWPVDQVSPDEYAARARRMADGSLDPDSVLLELLGGDPASLASLATQPDLPNTQLTEADRVRWRRAMQWRDWQLARMLPEWRTIVGGPVGGDVDGLRLRLDLLEALRLVHGAEVRWDPGSRTYTAVAEAVPAEDDGSP